MKKQDKEFYPPDWHKVAKKDWQRMKIMLDGSDFEAAGYFLQQSLEKYIKAFLLEKGSRLKKIHELDALLDDAVKYDASLEFFRGLCERVSGYYLAERYPPLVEEGLTSKDLEKDIKEAKRFVKALFK